MCEDCLTVVHDIVSEVAESYKKGGMMQCPECGTTGMSKYSDHLRTCGICGYVGEEKEIKAQETEHAQRFLAMCEESLNPDYFGVLTSQIIPAIEEARGITVTSKCPKCGQIDNGQMIRGEYPCPDCGLPTTHDPEDG